MPYIREDKRKHLEEIIIQLVMTQLENPGDLNYLFTLIAKRYRTCQGESYQTYNDIMGALECAQFELYRRKIADYEDRKIVENSDVW